MTTIKSILSILSAIINLFGNKKQNKIDEDSQIADAIRKGNGRKIAEIWKRRKYYK